MTSTNQQNLGTRVRSIADQLKQETALQIKATSRILGAAAQIAENHDQLINEVVDMVEDDIDQQTQAHRTNIDTADKLKQQFKTLRAAKAHFGLKANSWAELVQKLSTTANTPINPLSSSVSERLNTIENELKIMRTEIAQILLLVQKLVIEK